VADYVVFDSKSQVFRCTRCGVEETVVLPLAVTAFVATGKKVQKAHKGCVDASAAEVSRG
jgi:hypothetical protein